MMLYRRSAQRLLENMPKTRPTMLLVSVQLFTGPSESVWLLRFWPDQFFLKVETKFHFCKRQVINEVLSVILELVRLIILSYNR